MPTLLDAPEIRTLGCLIEKQVTTPEYYPLTLNALVNACNQLSNRDPVVSYDEKTVAAALENLREKNLVYVFYGSDSRVPKYKHVAIENLHLDMKELAVICVLMLRGWQTVGEIKGRTGRLYGFNDLGEVETTMESMATRELPLVMRLPRQPGRKESRYAHLLSGPIAVEEIAREFKPEPAISAVRGENSRIAELEAQVLEIRSELSELQRKFEDFQRQFE